MMTPSNAPSFVAAGDGDQTPSWQQEEWQPDRYSPPFAIKLVRKLPRYGYTKDIDAVLSDGVHDDYVQGIIISSCCVIAVVVVWCLVLAMFKSYSSTWISGHPERSPRGSRYVRASSGIGGGSIDDTSSTSSSASYRNSRSRSASSGGGGKSSRDGDGGDGSDDLSIESSIFWTNPLGRGGELTMAVIAREQRRDKRLMKDRRKHPDRYSTTTNGQLTLITTLDRVSSSSSSGDQHRRQPDFRVYLPPSLRLPLLRTYHDCLIHPDDVANADTMIYEFFTWRGIRRDVRKYVDSYRHAMGRGDNAAIVAYRTGDADAGLDEEDDTAITLDVIAQEQKKDVELIAMMEKSPGVFSTATNGSIRLITARGKDGKYRIVIPVRLQARVLGTYHDCLVNPTEENNFKKVLYVHFTWNGIHRDVENYVRNEGLTDEMRARGGGIGRGFGNRNGDDGGSKSWADDTLRHHPNEDDDEISSDDDNEESFDIMEDEEEGSKSDSSVSVYGKPIGLDEIAKEQKKDKELRQLKKEEPFVFSTVQYGQTVLTTAQNFRDNKYRIVIPQKLQGRMLETYRECLLRPTPDRNFDTLLYNHFTWNGIHDDVDYFVKNGGHLPEEDEDREDGDQYTSSTPLVEGGKWKKRDRTRSGEQDTESELARHDDEIRRKMRMIRLAFLASGLFTIISSILFFEQGVNRVLDSLSNGQRVLLHAKEVADSALSVAGEYIEIHSDIQDTAMAIGTYNTSQWCKAPHSDEIMNELTDQVQNSTFEIGVQLRDVSVRVDSEMRGIKHDLEQLGTTVQNIEATLEDFKTYTDVAKVMVIFIDIIVVSLMIACVLAWMGEQQFLPTFVRKTAAIIPLFVVMLIIFWIFSAAVLMGVLEGSDFCYKPDVSAIALSKRLKDQLSPLIFLLAVYYITGCLPEMRPTKLDSLTSAVSSIGMLVHSWLDVLATDIMKSDLVELCGSGDAPAKLVRMLELSDVAVHGLYDVLEGVTGVFECRNFNPIYTTMVHDALCSSAVPGLLWVFFSSLSMAIFSMFMVTLRAAIHTH